MMTHHRSASNGFAALLLAGLMLQGCAGSGDRVEQARGGEPAAAGDDGETGHAPTISPAETSVVFSDLDGIHAEIARRRGRPVLVNFWATWCVPCVGELKDLARLAEEYGDAGPAFVGISFDAWVTGSGDETEEKVRDSLATAGVTYANLIYEGDQNPILSAFDLPGPIPYSILYDRDGRAAVTWDTAIEIDRFRQAVAELP